MKNDNFFLIVKFIGKKILSEVRHKKKLYLKQYNILYLVKIWYYYKI